MSRNTFFEVLEREWGPLLARGGFGGGGTRFERRLGEVVQVIGVQEAKGGGSCCVNLAVHLVFLPLTTGRMIEGEDVRAESCEFQWRLAPAGLTD
jgi:hypothetical protein